MKVEFLIWQVKEGNNLFPPQLHETPLEAPHETKSGAYNFKKMMEITFGTDFTKDWVLCKETIEEIEEDEVIL